MMLKGAVYYKMHARLSPLIINIGQTQVFEAAHYMKYGDSSGKIPS